MAISATSLTSSGWTANAQGTSAVTASVSPTNGSLVLLWVEYSLAVAGSISNISGLGGTWTHVATSPNKSTTVAIELWWAVASSTGTVTITTSQNMLGVSWDVDQVTGANTTTPIVSANTVNTHNTVSVSTAASITYNQAAAAGNAFFGASYDGASGTAGAAYPAGWTALGSNASSNSTTGSGSSLYIAYNSAPGATTSESITLTTSTFWSTLGVEIAGNVAVDASTPANVDNTSTTVATATTASFTPPAGSLLLVCWAGNAGSGESPATPTITDNLGTHLTYTLIQFATDTSTGSTVDGQAALWWAKVVTSAAMTVSVTNNETTIHKTQAGLQVMVLTGADTTNPVTTSGVGYVAVGTTSHTQSYTAGSTGGMGFMSICDFANGTLAVPGGATGCTTIGGVSQGTGITYGYIRRTTADDVSGSNNTVGWGTWTAPDPCLWAWADINTPGAGPGPPPSFPTAVHSRNFSPSFLRRYHHGHFGPVPRQTAGYVITSSAIQYPELLAASIVVTGTTQNAITKIITGLVNVTGTVKRQAQRTLTALIIVTGTLFRKIQPAPFAASVAVTATVTAIRQRVLALAASIVATVSVQRTIGRILAAQVAVTATLQRQVSRGIAASVTIIATTVRSVSRTLAAIITATVTLAIQKVKLLTLAAQVVATATKSIQISKPLNASVVAAAAVARQVTRTLNATATVTATTIRSIARVLTAGAVTFSSVARRCGKPMAATVTVTASISARIGKIITATVVATGVLIRNISKNLAGQVAAIAAVSLIKVKLLTLTAQAVTTATLKNSIGKPLAGQITATVTVVNRIGKNITAIATATGSVIRQISRAVTAIATAAAVLSFTKVKLLTLSAVVAVTGTVKRSVGAGMFAQVTVTGAMFSRIAKAISVSVVVTGAVIRSIGRKLASSVVVTGTVSFIKVRLLNLTASIATTVSLGRQIKPILSASAILNSGVTRSVYRTIQGNLTVAGQTVRQIGREISANAAIAVAQSRVIGYIIAAGTTMSTFAGRQCRKLVTGSVNITGSVTRFISFHVKANTVITAQAFPGRAFLIMLTTTVNVTASFIIHAFSGTKEFVFKLGVPAFQWLLSSAKRVWRLGP